MATIRSNKTAKIEKTKKGYVVYRANLVKNVKTGGYMLGGWIKETGYLPTLEHALREYRRYTL